jgi:hypothetical protein
MGSGRFGGGRRPFLSREGRRTRCGEEGEERMRESWGGGGGLGGVRETGDPQLRGEPGWAEERSLI